MSFLITTRSSARPLRLALSSVALTRARSSFKSWTCLIAVKIRSASAKVRRSVCVVSWSSLMFMRGMAPSLIGVNRLVVVPSSLRSDDFAVMVVTKMPVRTRVPREKLVFCDGHHRKKPITGKPSSTRYRAN